jgi:hypothetical protein
MAADCAALVEKLRGLTVSAWGDDDLVAAKEHVEMALERLQRAAARSSS